MPRKRDISLRKGASSFNNDLNEVLDRVYKRYPNAVPDFPRSSADDATRFRKRHQEDAAELVEKLDELRALREKSEELATLRETLRDLRLQIRASRELREELETISKPKG
jgi:hypothetical protein